jgi:hypothetical protein
VFGTNVAVAYLQGTNYERVMTQTGPDGKFFVNLPQNQRGNAKVIVRGRGGIAVASTRIPTRKPIEMVIKPDAAMSYLDLSDKSPLSGVRVGSSYFFPDNRPPDRSIRLPGAETITNGRGMFFMPLGEKQKVELTFFLPDGQIISKIYSTDKMKRRGAVFVYDPVAPDILTDVEEPGDKNNGSDKNGQQNRHGNNRGGSSKGKDNNRKG